MSNDTIALLPQNLNNVTLPVHCNTNFANYGEAEMMRE